MYWFISYQ